MMTDIDFDPFGLADESDWATMAELRQGCPVFQPSPGVKYVARHEEAELVLRRQKRFAVAARSIDAAVEVPIEDRMVNELEGPRHLAVRRILVRALSPARVHQAETYGLAAAKRQLSQYENASGIVDIVDSYTVPLLADLTLHILGLPTEDASMLAEWARELLESTWLSTNDGPYGSGIAGSTPEFSDYLVEKMHSRVRGGTQGNDLLSELMTVQCDGEPLSERYLVTLMVNLILGGLSSTTNALGNMLWEALRSEDLYQRIHSDRSLVPIAVEESLRLRAPVPFVARSCPADVELSGTTIEGGERVVVGISSANRDEMFESSDHFDLDRMNLGEHLAFGTGPHSCVGAPLARMELGLGLEAFLDYFSPGSLRLVDSEYEPVKRFMEWGPQAIHVELVK
jgi:cytochrome P450